ncbi:MAG: GumC family protein [Terriglobales bacterium]
MNPINRHSLVRPDEGPADLDHAVMHDFGEMELPADESLGWRVWGRRRFLWRLAYRAALVALVIAFIIPKRFQSTTQFVPSDPSSGGTSMLASLVRSFTGGGGSGSGAGMAGLPLDPSSLLGTKTPGALYMEIINSRTVQDALINKFDLRKVYRTRYYELARKTLGKRTEVLEDRKSGVISLTVTDSDPRRAAAMAQAYLDEMNRLSAELNTSAAHRERLFIEQRLVTVKQDLDVAARKLADFSSRNSAIDLKEQGKAMVEAAATLQGQLIATESELKGVEQLYTPNNVRVKGLQARVKELQDQLQKLGGAGADEADTAQDGSTNAELYPSIRKLPLLARQYAEYYRQAKMEETLYELLTQQYEMAKIQEAKEIPMIKVLDEPDVPERKSFPPRLLIIVGVSLLALLGGIVWTYGEMQWEALPPGNPNKELLRAVYDHSKLTVVNKSAGLRERLRSRNHKMPPAA